MGQSRSATGRYRLLGLAVLTLLVPVRVWPGSEGTPAAHQPVPADVLEFDGGYAFDYRDGGKSQSYYRVSYKGALVGSKGTPSTYAHGLDLMAPARTEGVGDRNAWSVRLEKGTVELGGGLFEAEGIRPFTLTGLEGLRLRGTGLVGGDLDLKSIQFALGLETSPLRLPGFRKSGFANWVVFGISGQEGTESQEGDASFGLATYRAFLGQAHWRKSPDPGRTIARIAHLFLEQAPTYEKAKAVAAGIGTIPEGERTEIQKVFLEAVGETDSEDEWLQKVHEAAKAHAEAITDQPVLALYAESTGWYPFTDSPGGRRFRNLLAVTLDYWFMPERDDVLMRLRYENGHERSVPGERKNRLTLAAALRW